MAGVMEITLASNQMNGWAKRGIKLYGILLSLIEEGNSGTFYNMDKMWAQSSHENSLPTSMRHLVKIRKAEIRMVVPRC